MAISRNGVEVSGHARHGPYGSDIVCAAVSALTITLSESLRALDPACDPSSVMEEGHARITVRNMTDKAETLIDAFYIGTLRLSEAYPEAIDKIQII